MTYTDQDGVIWDADHAVCPRCQAPTDFDNRVRGSGYFRCCCGVMYDEPEFTEPEFAYLGSVEDTF